jgi:hypothetical protein
METCQVRGYSEKGCKITYDKRKLFNEETKMEKKALKLKIGCWNITVSCSELYLLETI